MSGSNNGLPRIVAPDDAGIALAAALLRDGGVVAVPTETVYGLAADAANADAVASIYSAKGRPDFNPLIVHVPDLAGAEALAVFDARAKKLAEAFWPGPLTLVLPRRDGAALAGAVTAGLSTVAIRCPAHPVMRALLAAAECPLAAPSANASGGISPTRAEHVETSLAGRIPLILDGGHCERGVESTIVALRDGGWQLLRPGPVTREALLDLLGPETAEARGIEAPGQLDSHYAPSKRVRLDAVDATPDEWWIGFGNLGGDDNLSAKADLAEAASRLFDALHQADRSGKAAIAVAPIPSDGIGAAINDRLRRAAA